MDTTDTTREATRAKTMRADGERVKLAVVQMSCSDVLEENLGKAEHFVREAAQKGANIVLLQELF
jgi:maleate cis-trans isomerase